ncbi:MAG: OsmC family protein [Acidobacteriota bacterium]|nr:OsmC family protein [Acidobacteriota bacterium]
MIEHTASIAWERRGARFTDHKYSRAHVWEFDGGATVRGSSSPHSVPLPYSDAAAVDPEEAYVAALASCHMLWFLALAAKRGFAVESYRDAAAAAMEKREDGKYVITRVTLRPHTVFASDGRAIPDENAVRELHHAAHEECYLANSVRSEIVTVPTFEIASATIPPPSEEVASRQ